MKHTKEQVKEYYNWLRWKWKEAKVLSESITELDKADLLKVQMSVPTMSWIWYMFCKIQMRNIWFEWLPWIDMKTFKGWKECWFKVKKWEKSKVFGITRIPFDKDDWESWMYPKVYHLFHTSQVEAI